MSDDVTPTPPREQTDEDARTKTPEEATPDAEGTRWALLGVAFAGLWLFVRGVELTVDGELVLGLVVGEFLIGLVVGLPIAFLFRRFYSPTPVVVRTPRAIVAGAKYFVLFTWELVTANVDVAYRVLAPSMPIDPDVIEVPLRVESDVAITTIANSITLTPGTLTMDYDPDRNSLYVHAISASDPDAVVEPIRAWEDYALVIFDERREPGSPVPEPVAEASVEHEAAGVEPTDTDAATVGEEGGDGDA